VSPAFRKLASSAAEISKDFKKFLLLFLARVIKTSGLVAGYLLVLFQKSFLKEFRLGASIPHGQAPDRSEIVSE